MEERGGEQAPQLDPLNDIIWSEAHEAQVVPSKEEATDIYGRADEKY